ncbi:MAG TPA: phosphatase PAP2 family protein [Longimicrobiales bacterium]|nr:phosphatase PAP2 family protein [Longimicrobiales bacterium]
MRSVSRLGRRAHDAYLAFGVVLSAGLLLALVGLLVLLALTEGVLDGETARIDAAILLWLDAHATPWLDRAAVEVTALGNGVVITVLTAVAAALLLRFGHWPYALLIAAAAAGGGAITAAIKELIDRPRPQLFEWRIHFPEPSAAYPSGHATIAMVTFAALAYIFHRIGGRPAVGLVATAVAAVLILLVGISRLYLGVHYPSDVVAGYIVGFTWVVVCALVAEALERRRRGTGRRNANEQ